MKPTRLFLSAVLATFCAAPALAGDPDHTVLNGQINLKNIVGELNIYVDDAGSLGQTASAQGNSFEAELDGSSDVDTYQINHSNVEADLNLEAGWIEGEATTVSQSFTNSATIKGDGTGGVAVNNYQEADPSCDSCYDDAKTFIAVDGVGTLDSSTTAVANSLNVYNNAPGTNINSQQINNSKMSAVSNIYVGYAGSLNASSAAVGNSVIVGK
ncbi:hypothetical protein [Tepidicaulis sp.]|jgi:hypothetical protein|uniref:hypothetical protein n=1 Tax=Tepidicaulis sp. TaxID=1920809 RepID=UPI003B5B449D